MFFRETVL